MKICHSCRKTLDVGRKVGRREDCPFCGSDLHVCLNCRFYDPGSYNDCREPQAERVVDKARSNFCDYFEFRDSASAEGEHKTEKNPAAQLEDLFKK
jgi:predicted RNA-binding Zn-ribbon protein involved in translation (DUF1610 family)